MFYYLRWILIFLRTIIWFILQWPRILIQREKVVQNSENPLSWQRLKYHIFKDLLALHHTAKLGNKAPNCNMKTVEGEPCNLLDFMRLGRPLVLNFGSCTWDYFIEVLQQFKQVVADFADVADFLIVYTAEGHPVEGWRIKVRPSSVLFSTTEFSLTLQFFIIKYYIHLGPRVKLVIDRQNVFSNKYSL